MCTECLDEKHAGVIYGLHTGDYDFRYIGKSVNHKQRFSKHIYWTTRGEGNAVHDWMRKHGAENIQMTVIETFTDEDLHMINDREILHIAQARAYYGKNLNLTDGGDGQTGRVMSDEEKARRSGYRHTDEAKAKISAASAGNKHSLGYKHSDEAKARIASARQGKKLSESTKAKIALTKTGNSIGGHTRWHVKRNLVNPDCRLCTNENGSQL